MEILYYEEFAIVPKRYKDSPIMLFKFRDIKTGDRVILGTCNYAEEYSKITGRKFYPNIDSIDKDNICLWRLSASRVSNIGVPFEKIEEEYKTLIKDSDENEVVDYLIQKYASKAKQM